VCKSLLVRGLNALAALISTPLGAPVIAATLVSPVGGGIVFAACSNAFAVRCGTVAQSLATMIELRILISMLNL
jgi:hypothetical protein